MQFEWTFAAKHPQLLRTFVRERGISRALLARIKFQGGTLLVNGIERTVRYQLTHGDRVRVAIPNERAQPNVLPAHVPIDVLYEDAHFLIVNKPAGVASIPSYQHPEFSMANRVKGYLIRQNEPNQVIHIVTRLDRDTSGVMLFAKHQFAHAMLDVALREKTVDKQYLAFLPHQADFPDRGEIDLPIGRTPDSIMTRQVRFDETGKPALTSYEITARHREGMVAKIKLHTGRTHQIRVHFSHLGLPLLGDSLYDGDMTVGMQRQALHCQQLTFYHPFDEQWLTLTAPLPADMQHWLCTQQEEVPHGVSN